MKLTIEQTNKILQKLEEIDFGVYSNKSLIIDGFVEVSEEYFCEKVNEALEGVKMNNIDIIKQLMTGNHLERNELQRSRELLTALLNSANQRFFEVV